ncbi:MAG: hypothetical protein HYU37_12820 [Acidobacteria bacterium]|nr:hypothetical protein [Acidobacteriota bacterium]
MLLQFGSTVSGHARPDSDLDLAEYNDLDAAKVFDAVQAAARDIPYYVERTNAYVSSCPG